MRNKLPTEIRLLNSLKVATKGLRNSICKLEKDGANPLMIATRKKELAKIQEELDQLSRRSPSES